MRGDGHQYLYEWSQYWELACHSHVGPSGLTCCVTMSWSRTVNGGTGMSSLHDSSWYQILNQSEIIK
jgi:hypothetical protein